MQSYRIVVSLFAVAALAVGVHQIPQPEERIALMALDGKADQARRELLALYTGGDRRSAIVVQMAQAHMAIGAPLDAAPLLRDYRLRYPDDATALQSIAALARAGGDDATYLAALHHLVKLQPTRARIRSLLARYRQLGRSAEEMALLEKLAPGDWLDTAERVRIAALQVGAGRPKDAIAHLTAAVGTAKADYETRLLLFSLLIDERRLDDAERFARDWYRHWRGDWRADDLVRRAAIQGQEALALRIADGIGELRPEAPFVLAGVFAEEKRRDLAVGILRGWAARNPDAMGAQLSQYVTLCRALGIGSDVYQRISELARAPRTAERALRLADALARVNGLASVAPVLPLFPIEMLKTRPLFASALAQQSGNPLLARMFLKSQEPTELDLEGRRQWMALMRTLASPQELFARMDVLRIAGRLPVDLRQDYTELARQLGRMTGIASAPALLGR